jgi:nicotinate-nucleotide adenylyltransferase
MSVRRLGIFGGTLDPIHFGHLIVAEQARVQLRLDEVQFIPCGEPAIPKDYAVTPGEHRYVMAQLATASHPAFRVRRLEIDRPGPSFTVDTLRQLRAEVGPEADFFFILGSDALRQIYQWHQSELLFHLCYLAVGTRPGYGPPSLDHLRPEHRERVIPFQTVPVEISGRLIRSLVAAGQSVRYLLPESVEEYLQKHRLYRKSEGG